jgi:hypothetical protein
MFHIDNNVKSWWAKYFFVGTMWTKWVGQCDTVWRCRSIICRTVECRVTYKWMMTFIDFMRNQVTLPPLGKRDNKCFRNHFAEFCTTKNSVQPVAKSCFPREDGRVGASFFFICCQSLNRVPLKCGYKFHYVIHCPPLPYLIYYRLLQDTDKR